MGGVCAGDDWRQIGRFPPVAFSLSLLYMTPSYKSFLQLDALLIFKGVPDFACKQLSLVQAIKFASRLD